jgi:NAD(P)-dependent dehydrogenase (short-subunit alcohol dehydrogenase family)
MRSVISDIEEAALYPWRRNSNPPGHLPCCGGDVSERADLESLPKRRWMLWIRASVFNNAAFSSRRLWGKIRSEWEWVLGVNLWGVIHGIEFLCSDAGKKTRGPHCHHRFMGGFTRTRARIYKVTKHGIVTLSENPLHE